MSDQARYIKIRIECQDCHKLRWVKVYALYSRDGERTGLEWPLVECQLCFGYKHTIIEWKEV
jgi:hypothetical protein